METVEKVREGVLLIKDLAVGSRAAMAGTCGSCSLELADASKGQSYKANQAQCQSFHILSFLQFAKITNG
jgi:hypothetical protein